LENQAVANVTQLDNAHKISPKYGKFVSVGKVSSTENYRLVHGCRKFVMWIVSWEVCNGWDPRSSCSSLETSLHSMTTADGKSEVGEEYVKSSRSFFILGCIR